MRALPSRTVQNTSVLFVENYIHIRCQIESGYDAPNVGIGLMKNAPTQMLIMFVLIVTPTTTCKATDACMYLYVTSYPMDATTKSPKGENCYSVFIE